MLLPPVLIVSLLSYFQPLGNACDVFVGFLAVDQPLLVLLFVVIAYSFDELLVPFVHFVQKLLFIFLAFLACRRILLLDLLAKLVVVFLPRPVGLFNLGSLFIVLGKLILQLCPEFFDFIGDVLFGLESPLLVLLHKVHHIVVPLLQVMLVVLANLLLKVKFKVLLG